MANYLDQIPKQLAARRKAFAAARDNPALLPSCWAITRSIANNAYEYMRNSVVGGCTFPDRPIYLAVESAAFLNFGTTPKLLLQDTFMIETEAQGSPFPDAENPQLPPESRAKVGRRLAQLASVYGQNHRATRVYNLEAWLQDMYRDRLDVDFAEGLQRQIDALNRYMDSVPKAIAATGLNAKLSQGVMNAFTLFKTITGSSHQLDREKMSFTDRRSYVDTMQKIEAIMTMADESLGSAVAGRSVVREQYALWKDANYEMMALTRELRALWAGTSLDDRIAELTDLLSAVQKTMNRATEESRNPKPQLPIARGDAENPDAITRADITAAFHAVCLYDMFIGSNTLVSTREIRKFGPVCVVIVPGDGQPRYCSEIRKLRVNDDEDTKRTVTKAPAERELDVDRRVRYPLNCLTVPINSPKATLLDDMADAWLEYNQAAYPVTMQEYLEAAKAAAPAAFLPPPDKDAKFLPATYSRQVLARLTAAFVRWSISGAEPTGEGMPGFAAFREMVSSRLESKTFLIPLRYRPLAHLYSDAGPKRRLEMWKLCLGPRFALDRQLVAVNVLRKDWVSLHDSLKYLPQHITKGNSNLDNGFARVKDAGDPLGGHKAAAFFRKFLEEQPDLKSALVAVESQAAIEVETLRTQSESLGRVFQYDQAAEAMLQRQASQIREKRNAANAHIDQYLTGIMHAMDGNYKAAEGSLVMCLTPPAKRETDDEPPPPVPKEVDTDWFEANLKPLDSKFEKRRVPGEDGLGTVCYDFAYYNLGIVYMKQQRYHEARMAFRAVLDLYPAEISNLVRLWAEELAEEAKEKMSPREPAR